MRFIESRARLARAAMTPQALRRQPSANTECRRSVLHARAFLVLDLCRVADKRRRTRSPETCRQGLGRQARGRGRPTALPSHPSATGLSNAMPSNILNVERERDVKAARMKNDREAHRQSTDVLSVEKDRKVKHNLSNREAQLQALAAAERARREATKQQSLKQALSRPASRRAASQSQPTRDHLPAKTMDEPVPTPSTTQQTEHQEQSPSSQPPKRGVCTVVKVYPDGFVDLQLSSGEIVERVEQSWLTRLGRPPSEDTEPPPPTAGSRPPTAGSRPPTGASRPTTGASRPPTGASRPPTAALSPSQANASTAAPLAYAAKAPAPPTDLASIIDLDETLAGMGRRGGRGNLAAQRAQLSDMSSLLSWQ